ncbi:zinc dependent phospholipase C family protein [Massilia sp. CF038]|uniref:zinc dependent phospholipase C family protein n=1 Tax=Massilia sp. CF038 TaxID=1881045 RepID=UPI000922E2C7|nr:zinc dependent phospholipase C family protein [Massilia sp. CF038]SHG75304.1 Zinc dependent phospholipase C [Massilia sp. CF038]
MRLALIRKAALALTLACALVPAAQAFKADTHIWVGQQVINDLADDGKITVRLNGRSVTLDVPADVRDAILANRSDYLLGNIGPDSAPDLIVGQTIVHPGLEHGWKTNDWLQHLLDNSRANAPAKAYTYGYLGHAAADTFAHTYVNQYSGDIFLLEDREILVEERHIALEGFISKLTPPLTDHTGKVLGPVTSVVKPTNAFGTFARDTLVMNDTVYQQYSSVATGAHLAAFYKLRKGIDSLAQDPRWNQIDAAVLRIIALQFNINLSQANSQKIIDRANVIIPKLQRKEDNVQSAFNDIVNAAGGLDDRVFKGFVSTANRMNTLEHEVVDLSIRIAQANSRLISKSCPPKWLDPLCSAVLSAVEREINEKIYAELRGLNDSAANKRQELINLTVGIRDAAVKGQKLIQIVTNAQIDFAQRMGSNTSPIKAALLGWRNDLDLGMLEYTKATSQMILNSTDPNADALAPMTRWIDCYGKSVIGIPLEVSGCAVMDGAKDFTWAVDRVTKLADELTSVGELFGLPSPSDIEAWKNEQIENLKAELTDQILNHLLSDEVRQLIGLFKTDMTDDALNMYFTKPESRVDKKLISIPDMAARVRAEMYLKNGYFDPDRYAVARNAVTLAKLALLDKAGLTRLAEQAGVGANAPFAATDNVVAGAFASIDGNHQWMALPPKRPNYEGGASYKQPPSYAAPAGFIPWRSDVRSSLFRALFTGPLSPGIDAPALIGFPALLPNDYPYRPCVGRPFPSDENDRTCAYLQVMPSLMQLLGM